MKKTDLFFTGLLFLTLFLLLVYLNNYEIKLHNIDLSYNVVRMVEDFNIKINKATNSSFYYINSSKIKDEYEPDKTKELSKMYISSIIWLRRIILPIIFISLTLGYSLCYVINKNGRRRKQH